MKKRKLIPVMIAAAAALLAVIVIIPMAAAGREESRRQAFERKIEEIDALKDIDGPMLVISESNMGMISCEEDFWSSRTYRIYYNGIAERRNVFNLTGTSTDMVLLTDEQMADIYDFCMEYGESDEFSDYEEYVCDGAIATFTYYDEDGEAHVIYSGYCYANETLLQPYELVSSCFLPYYTTYCLDRIRSYPDIYDTLTDPRNPQIEYTQNVPGDIYRLTGREYDGGFYAYTFATTEDSESGPVVVYVSAEHGSVLGFSPNREWEVTDATDEDEGIMLSIVMQCGDRSGDYLTGIHYNIYRSGMIEKVLTYSVSDPEVTTATLRDSDLEDFRDFCDEYGTSGAFDDYFESVCDGETRTFIYYEPYGTEHTIYSGYCYSNEALDGIFDLACSYFRD